MTNLRRNDDGFDSIAWALEIHVGKRDDKGLNFAILYGNEDAPDCVEFFPEAEPTVYDKPLYIWTPANGLQDRWDARL